MSTVNTTNVKNTSSTKNNIVLSKSGDTTIQSLNTGPLAGFRNQLINGNMLFWQRGDSFPSNTGANQGYTADRWRGGGSGANTVTRADVSDNSIPFTFAMQDGGDNNVSANFQQGIELPAAGQAGSFIPGSTWTVSCYAKRASTTVPMRVVLSFSDTTIGGNGVEVGVLDLGTVTTSWTRLSATVTIPGGSVPGATNECLAVRFQTGTVSGGVVDNTEALQVTGCQLEPGSVATPYEVIPIQTQLANCQRYYYRANSSGSARLASGYARSASQANAVAFLPVTQRGPSTFSRSEPATFAVGYQATGKVCSNLTASVTNDYRTLYFDATTSSLTAGEGVALVANGECWWAMDAEF